MASEINELFDLFFSGPVGNNSRVEAIFNEKFMYSIFRFYENHDHRIILQSVAFMIMLARKTRSCWILGDINT